MQIPNIRDVVIDLENEFKKDPIWVDRQVLVRPSIERLRTILNDIKVLFFPGYFSDRHHLSLMQNLETISHMLYLEVKAGMCFACRNQITKNCESSDPTLCAHPEENTLDIVFKFLHSLKTIRNDLLEDIQAAYMGDPAATGPDEVLYSYPGIKAMIHHRIAHELYKLKTPIIPRIISEIAHSETGIDIHPGAEIAAGIFIDHGTGVVIGETTVIGKNVKIYQGVTLGARSFPLDKDGNPVKGVKRHPIIEDNVTIYAEATILGRVTIGKGSMIGGNVCITKDVPADSKIIQQVTKKILFNDGDGI